MQDRLEEFVKANRDAFDSEEPSSGVWENIEASFHRDCQLRVYGKNNTFVVYSEN